MRHLDLRGWHDGMVLDWLGALLYEPFRSWQGAWRA
jgi:hypothetical protein